MIATVKRSVLTEFEQFCKGKSIEPNNDNLVLFLISHNYIPPVTVKRSFIIHSVRAVSTEQSVTSKLNSIEFDFKIPVRTAWRILGEYYNYFTFNKLYEELIKFK